MKRCWEFLDLTSRSFAMVIKELDGELCRVVGRLAIGALQGLTRRLRCAFSISFYAASTPSKTT